MSKHILRHDAATITPVKCLKCGDMIVYNGNFYCNSMDAIGFDKEKRDIYIIPGSCDWALQQPPTRRKDREIEIALHAAGRYPSNEYLMED
jgi:hypothetical protein